MVSSIDPSPATTPSAGPSELRTGTAHVLAIDQGTTGTTSVLYAVETTDRPGEPRLRVLSRRTRDFAQHFPAPGWVEHRADEIWESVVGSVRDVLSEVPQAASGLAAIGVTNQRETVVLWERATGRAVGPVLVWQDRRTSERCHELRASADARLIEEMTGLVVDPYFSATKLEWVFKNDPGLLARARAGEICVGTMDSYLVSRIGGPGTAHVIEFTNASRTLLFDIHKGCFDDGLLDLFSVPRACLPRVIASDEIATKTRGFPGLPDGIVVSGIAGDQHAALFGQGALQAGQGKCTFGTGAFLLVSTGDRAIKSSSGLLTTPAWKLGDRVTYSLEGSAFVAGAAVGWLRDGLGIIDAADQVEALARQVSESGGVFFVPALAGLGAPHWVPDARGMLTGLTRGTTRAHVARAVLDGIAHQVSDLLETIDQDLALARLSPLATLRVDGGAARNDLLLELVADYAGLTVERGTDTESTARGAALLAMKGAGLMRGEEAARSAFELDRAFPPPLDRGFAAAERQRYRHAMRACVMDAELRRGD